VVDVLTKAQNASYIGDPPLSVISVQCDMSEPGMACLDIRCRSLKSLKRVLDLAEEQGLRVDRSGGDGSG